MLQEISLSLNKKIISDLVSICIVDHSERNSIICIIFHNSTSNAMLLLKMTLRKRENVKAVCKELICL